MKISEQDFNILMQYAFQHALGSKTSAGGHMNYLLQKYSNEVESPEKYVGMIEESIDNNSVTDKGLWQETALVLLENIK